MGLALTELNSNPEHHQPVLDEIAAPTPVLCALRADELPRQAEIRPHADQHGRRQRGGQGVEQGGGAIRRFDEKLGGLVAARRFFERLDASAALGLLGRQVAVEGETLPTQAAMNRMPMTSACHTPSM